MTGKPDTASLRRLPQIEELLRQPCLAELQGALPHDLLLDAARLTVDETRQCILAGGKPDLELEHIAQAAAQRARKLAAPSLRHVVNATGIIIHTNLGRSVLAPEAIEAVDRTIAGYSTLEYDIEHMSRGSRHAHCEHLICMLTGAEAAIAVNNNAAAVLLVLSEFSSGREAIVSRGELVEIGGSFRIPDIMQLSRTRMVEVGTTNRTHPDDYRRALTDDTAMLVKVHPSNYRMIGFTESVDVAGLRSLADAAATHRDADNPLLVYEDQGSGVLVHLGRLGEEAEATVGEALRDGADLVSFSGDKLLGGPQAGIIVGSRELIGRLKRNPLVRALRLDKMTLAALEATLRLYLAPDCISRIPTLRMLDESAASVRRRAEHLKDALATHIPEGCVRLAVIPEVSRAGGGALPMCDIDTYALEVSFLRGDAQSCSEYLTKMCHTPIVVRVKQECVLCDPRTILDGEAALIAEGFAAYFSHLQETR